MDYHDIKVFIVGFLVLAILGGTATLIFSNYFTTTPTKTTVSQTPNQSENANLNYVPGISKNAPVEQVQENNIISGNSLASNPSGNLTDKLIDTLAVQVVSVNPQGPQQSTDGTAQVAVPDNLDQAVEQHLKKVSNDLLSTQINESKIHIKEKYTKTDILSYLREIEAILKNSYRGTEITQLRDKVLSEEPNPEMLVGVNLFFVQTQEKFYRLEVPKPFVPLHKLYLSLLETEKITIDSSYQTDPVKTLVLINDFDNALSRAQTRIQKEIATLKKNTPQILSSALSQDQKSSKSFTVRLGVIKEVNAFALPMVPVVDLAAEASLTAIAADTTAILADTTAIVGTSAVTAKSTTGNWLHRILTYLKLTATEILKDQLVHRLVWQVIGWVQGGGKPQFITNWKGFFKDVAKEAAGRAISDLAPGLCKPLGPLVQSAFFPVQTANVKRGACTLDQIIGNIKGFYDSFQNGGWSAYATVMRPSNNLFGNFIQVHDSIMQRTGQDVETKKQDAQANQGFLSGQKCIAPRTLTMTRQAILNFRGAPGYVSDTCGQVVFTENNTGECTVTICNQEDFRATTPGSIVYGQLNQHLAAPLHRIVNADDLIALVNALVNAALTKLIGLADRGITGLFQSGSGNGGTNPSPIGSDDPCLYLTGEALANCRGLTNINPSSSSINTVQSQLLQVLNSHITALQDAQRSNNQWLQMATNTISQLQAISQGCSTSTALIAEASDRITSIQQVISVAVQTDNTTISNQIADLQDLYDQVDAAQDITTLDALSSQIDQINRAQIDSLQERAEIRVQNLITLKSRAELINADTTGLSCSEQLPPL